MKFGSKKTWKHYVYSWPTVVMMSFIAVLMGMSVWERYMTAHIMKERRITAESEVEALRTKKTHLEEQVEYLEGERGIEEELRRNFDVAKPGEEVIVLTGTPDTMVENVEESTTSSPWWQFWR